MEGWTEEQYKRVFEGLEKVNQLVTLFGQLKIDYGDLKKDVEQIIELKIAFAELRLSIVGNGTKGLKDRTTEAENKIEVLEKCKEKPPRFSWKQVFVNAILIITVAGFLSGSFYYPLSELSGKTTRIEEKLDNHIIVKP